MTGHQDATEPVRARIQTLSTRQQELERALAAGLTTDHHGLMVMNALVGDGPSTPGALARGLAISPAAMSLVLQRLERAGHVIRSIHPADRRKVVVSATEPSRRAALALIQPVVDGLGEIVAELSESELDTVEKFLDRLNELYREVAAGSAVGPAAEQS